MEPADCEKVVNQGLKLGLNVENDSRDLDASFVNKPCQKFSPSIVSEPYGECSPCSPCSPCCFNEIISDTTNSDEMDLSEVKPEKKQKYTKYSDQFPEEQRPIHAARIRRRGGLRRLKEICLGSSD
ncbi:unnamed protein product [Moneuplotes crassus]|uniref:Uncharacterized protein n=1 Tax=Euplotes crassus TaxID=5936 RepID=A0AAD1XSC0_EUPCR|nr:unnamed protein product [Moneuplotes crassus]